METPKKRVGFVLFDRFTALDLFGPMEVLRCSQSHGGADYQIQLIGDEQRLYKAESGARVMADITFDQIDSLDLLIVPGGKGTRIRTTQEVICPWLRDNAHKFERIVSICTGAFLLAEAGLVNDKTITTHWQYVDEFQCRYPNIKLQANALFVQNEHISTSAGVSSGIDLALKIVEDDNGSEVAAKIARMLVVHYRRSGDQAQYSEPLKFQQKADSAFSSLSGWIMNHLSNNLSTQVLAEQAGMSERNFYRRFKLQMGVTPSKYIERIRLDYARQLLTEKDWPNKRIAQACGYPQVDVFRRAFERRFAVSPKDYRQRFKHAQTH